jgi:hypothetical protein
MTEILTYKCLLCGKMKATYVWSASHGRIMYFCHNCHYELLSTEPPGWGDWTGRPLQVYFPYDDD